MLDEALVVSGELLRNAVMPADLQVDEVENVVLRGRQEPLEAHVIRGRRV
jgi:hypothetical protein